jgi:hypothetical protein
LAIGGPKASLVAGRYALSFRLSSKGEDEEMKAFVKHPDTSGKLPPCWEGKGNTTDVSFEIIDPPPEF